MVLSEPWLVYSFIIHHSVIQFAHLLVLPVRHPVVHASTSQTARPTVFYEVPSSRTFPSGFFIQLKRAFSVGSSRFLFSHHLSCSFLCPSCLKCSSIRGPLYIRYQLPFRTA